MLVMSLTTLTANLFIELNKIKDIKKIYLTDIYEFNNILNEECSINQIDYFSQTNLVYFNELKFNYSMFFDVYEDDMDYCVKLKDYITQEDLINYFRKDNIDIKNKKTLLYILEKINFENFINKKYRNK